jgi:ArsR family transcriptional regulator
MNTYSYVDLFKRLAMIDELCDVQVIHEDAVHAALRERTDPEAMTLLADTFQILANPIRLQIVEALAKRELCVCDVAAVVGASQSAISHHLRLLRQMRIVSYRKEGRIVYYRLTDDHIREMCSIGLEHVRE